MKLLFRNVVLYICLCSTLTTQSIDEAISNSFIIFNNDNEIHVALDIIQRCFYVKGRNIVLTGNLTSKKEYLILNSLYSSLVPLSLISVYEDIVFKIHKRFNEFYKLNETIVKQKLLPATNFIIVAPSQSIISESLRRVKDSIWWNHEGIFFIINTDFENGCDLAHDYLHSVWSLNILSALLLCSNANKKLRLYTFNPYSQSAPSFWKVLHRDRTEFDIDNNWTLFEHTIEKADSLNMCDNINFDKTRNLYGYNIRIGVKPYFTDQQENYVLNGDTDEKSAIAFTLWNHLNASTNFTIYKSMNYGNGTEKPSGIFGDLLDNKIDYSINIIFQRDLWRRQTYPHVSSGLCVVARKQRVSVTARFLKAFSPWSWCIVVFSCCASVFLLKLILKRTLSASVLEVLRMIVGLPSYGQPKSLGGRRFFTIFIFVTMAANSYFQSRLNAMYIAPDSDPTIDTAEDLNASQLTIYGHPNFKDMLFYKSLRDRYKYTDDTFNCINRLEEGEEIVCLYPCNIYNVTDSDEIHVAKNKMRDLYLAFMIREDWPLISRVNQILRRIFEAGLSKFYEERERIKFFKHIKRTGKWEAVSMAKSTATFFILIWIAIISISIFLIEIFIHSRSLIVRYF